MSAKSSIESYGDGRKVGGDERVVWEGESEARMKQKKSNIEHRTSNT